MGLFERVKSVVSSKAWPGHAEWIPAERAGPAGSEAPGFAADSTYLRLWLTEARLEHSRRWFTEWHPAVHSVVVRDFGHNRHEQVAVINPGSIPGFTEAANAAVTTNKPLTPLLPFSGGTVSINTGLVAVKGDNSVRTLIDVVGSFGGLLTTTALSTGLGIAGQVVDAFEQLLNIDGNVGTLAYDGSLAMPGGNGPVLAPGFLAVLDQPPPQPLWVANGHLVCWSGDGPSSVPPGSFLLLRLESRVDRDDWRYLSPIEEPLQAARAAVDADTRRAHYQRAIIAARTSLDLHEADRIRIATALRGQRDQDAGLGAVTGGPEDLAALAEAASMPVADALEARPSLASLLA
ncbi:hypothetical protein [Agromyces sp. ZXT2-6]|uniref:hypothetical protein n=1 Tax=Agromyces sp. ZXT2-6 TaxID=3461153 RepID=UPI0040552487